MKLKEAARGHRMGDNETEIICYADDAVSTVVYPEKSLGGGGAIIKILHPEIPISQYGC